MAPATSSCSTAKNVRYATHTSALYGSSCHHHHVFSQPVRNPVVKPGRELRDMLDFFNIDASVPVVVMTQDVARTFASSKDDRTMFKLYYECLEFDKTQKALDDAQYNVQVAFEDLKKAREQLQVGLGTMLCWKSLGTVQSTVTITCMQRCHKKPHLTTTRTQAIEQRRQAVEEQLELLTEVDAWYEQLHGLHDFLVLRAVRNVLMSVMRLLLCTPTVAQVREARSNIERGDKEKEDRQAQLERGQQEKQALEAKLEEARAHVTKVGCEASCDWLKTLISYRWQRS